MRTFTNILLGLSFLLLVSSCNTTATSKITIYDKTPEEIDQIDNRLEKVVNTFVGHYSNQKQLDESNTSGEVLQETMIRRMWKNRTGEYWTCGVWFLNGDEDNPMMLNIVNFKRPAPDTFVAYAYVVPNIEENKQEWKKINPYAHLSPKDLDPKQCFTNTYVFDGTMPLCNIDETIGPSITISENIKFQKMMFCFTSSTFTVFSDFMDMDKNIVTSSNMRFDRIPQDDPRYYAPIQRHVRR